MVLAIAAAVGAVVVAPWDGSSPRRLQDRHPTTGRARVPSGEKPILQVLDVRLRRAGISLDARVAVRLWLASSVVGAISTALVLGADGPVGLILGVTAGAVVPVVMVLVKGDDESRRVMASLPEMLELLARSLRGGADLHTALHDLSDGTNEAGLTLKPVLLRVEAGGRLGESFDRWVVDLGHRDASIVRAVIRLGDSTGGSMAPALDRAAATIRERSAIRAEVRALTSQSRASAIVIAASPIGFLAVVSATDPRSAHVLFATSIGRACLIGGLLLDGLGLLWMSRLTSGVER